jgi:hypothetical protein
MGGCGRGPNRASSRHRAHRGDFIRVRSFAAGTSSRMRDTIRGARTDLRVPGGAIHPGPSDRLVAGGELKAQGQSAGRTSVAWGRLLEGLA